MTDTPDKEWIEKTPFLDSPLFSAISNWSWAEAGPDAATAFTRMKEAVEAFAQSSFDQGVEREREASAREIAKLTRINEIQASAINAWVPCSGHRGKTVKGHCLLCAVERIQNEAQRAYDSSDIESVVRRRLATIIGYADESLGRALTPTEGERG